MPGRKRRIQAVSGPWLHVPGKKWNFEAKRRANDRRNNANDGVETTISLYDHRYEGRS
jgi:hypothetical protein